MAEGRLAEAVLTYRQGLISHPDDPDLLSGLGLALAAQGRGRAAAEVLNRAATLKPEEVSLKNTLADLITKPQNGLALNLAWISASTDSEPVGAAAAAGRIFVTYADGHLSSLDQTSGQVLWDIQAPAALVSMPAADAGQVWVGDENGSVLIYAAGSGRKVGNYLTGGAVFATPVLSPDLAFCASSDGSLYAIDRTTLELTWKARIGEGLNATPLVNGQSVYVGSNDGRIYGFNAASGARLWPYGIPTRGALESIPSLAEGRIIFGSDDGRIYALDAETGGEYWRFSTPDAVYARPLVLDGQVIVASIGMEMASIRFADGSPNWRLPFEHPITDAPVFFKDRLFLVTLGDARLFSVDYRTGNRLGELNTGDWLTRGPLLAGSDLILLGKDGAVILYR